MVVELNKPHGGELVDLYLQGPELEAEKTRAREYESWTLSYRQLCDLELLMNGAFSPLTGFMKRNDYEAVCDDMRLANGDIWSMPITLDVSDEFAASVEIDQWIALRDPEGLLYGTMQVEDIWIADKSAEAKAVFGADDSAHPGVDYLHNSSGEVYLGGTVRGIESPLHYDYQYLRDTPSEVRAMIKKRGWRRVVAFHSHAPMHCAHHELTYRAAQQVEANLLIHPAVGMTRPGDIDQFTRVRCYEHIIKRYPDQTSALSLLPLAMRMAGPREALWHALIRKNFGCTHFIVVRDHAGMVKTSEGKPFYEPNAAQALLDNFSDELGIDIVPAQTMVYVQERAEYRPVTEITDEETVQSISDAELKRRLEEALEVPEWFSYPEIVDELRRAYPPRHKQGFTVFFTGLSGAGKSTVANALVIKLQELGGRPVTLLDGDVVRTHLSSELGFTREHRDLNIVRIGFVASEITKNGGVAICAPIAPYRSTRRKVREMVSGGGGFVEVYIGTSIEVCEARDRKGLYAKARAGMIKGFTGIDDPYEVPEAAELEIDTSDCQPDEAAQRIILKLENMGFIK
ncbi:MAG: bifunctional sulfate adenylyltransferase/adenylylsulfate kinase [Pseudomonadota bacterium]